MGSWRRIVCERGWRRHGLKKVGREVERVASGGRRSIGAVERVASGGGGGRNGGGKVEEAQMCSCH